MELAAQYVLFLRQKCGLGTPEVSADFLENKDKVAQEFYEYKMGRIAKDKEKKEEVTTS